MNDSFSMQQIEEHLIAIFNEHKTTNVEVTLESVVTADLGVDSLVVMETVAELEDYYGLSLPDDELPKIRTIGDVKQLVTQGLKQAGRLT